jgi:3-hydroxybutyryl-CoA dehydrogenase
VSAAAPAMSAGPAAGVKKVAVVGGGTMGNGIAQVFATAGIDVELVDAKPEFVERALGAIGKNLDRVAKKQSWPAGQAPGILARIHGGTSLSVAGGCEVIVEAVSEDFALKKGIFEELDRTAPPAAILATNTSSISITGIAAVTKRPAQVIGMHFMNPVPVMALVEIIRGIATSDATYALTEDLARRLGKTPVEVNDSPGFVSNRILMPMINEACYTLMEGVASRDEARHGAPDGAAPARRPDRPRHVPLDHGGAARGARRFEVPALPAAAKDGRGGMAGAEDGTGVLRVPGLSGPGGIDFVDAVPEGAPPGPLRVVSAGFGHAP